jgi:hypothetical protein
LIFVGTLTADRLSLPVRGESHQGLDGDWFGTLTSSTQNTPALRTGPATLTLKDGAIWHIVVAATAKASEYRAPTSYFRIDQMHFDRNGLVHTHRLHRSVAAPALGSLPTMQSV